MEADRDGLAEDATDEDDDDAVVFAAADEFGREERASVVRGFSGGAAADELAVENERLAPRDAFAPPVSTRLDATSPAN